MTRFLCCRPWRAGLGLLLLATSPAAAAAALGLPLDCEPGQTCWIVNYVDHDAGPDARDYRCGPLTYDGHGGTDFAIRDLAAMAAGVTVRAAADGTVVGARGDEADVSVRQREPGSVRGRECGNGVRIRHADGLVTQYCHLRRGSVSVRRGERVKAGQAIGQVGLSGDTEFPHLHLGVSRDGKVVDPFTGRSTGTGCGVSSSSEWRPEVAERLRYARRQIYHLGLAGQIPTTDRVRAGDYGASLIGTDAPVLAAWVEAFGVATGDTVRLRLEGPKSDVVVDSSTVVERDQARVFQWAGRRSGGTSWLPGDYQLMVEIAPADGSPPTRAAAAGQVR